MGNMVHYDRISTLVSRMPPSDVSVEPQLPN